MARRLLAEGCDADFVLVGPDEGEGAAVSRTIAALGDSRLRWEGAVDPSMILDRMREASLLVLPSIHEPYPMSVIEAMSLARPVVVTNTCGLADVIANTAAGLVVDDDDDGQSLLTGMRTLLANPLELTEAGKRAHGAAIAHFGLDAISSRLESYYRASLASSLAHS
jgi:glycosyltransferase involved in cell wall biosynthesis